MASRLHDTPLTGVTFLERQQAYKRIADRLNERRWKRGPNRFAAMYVSEVLEYPLTKMESFVIVYSEGDRAVELLAKRIERDLREESRRRAGRLERVTEQHHTVDSWRQA